MSTPRPRATQGCPEDAHTPAKSHTLLHLLKQTRAMGHTGRATTKKKKRPGFVGFFSVLLRLFLVWCFVLPLFCRRSVASAVPPVLRPGFLWIYPFLSGRQPKNWPSQFFSGIPSQSALRRWYAVWTWSIYLLGPSRSHVVLKIYSRGAAHIPVERCVVVPAETSVSTVALLGLSAGGSRYGRFGGGTLLQVTQSCVARRNLSFIIERETTLLRCTSQAPHEPGRVALPREPSAESVSSDGNRPSSGENGCRHYAGANLDTTLCAVLAAAYLNTGRSHFWLQTHHGSESTRSPQFLCGRTRLLTNSVSSKGRTSTSLAERR